MAGRFRLEPSDGREGDEGYQSAGGISVIGLAIVSESTVQRALIYNFKNMSERKTWLEQEDRVLKMLVVERGLTKWAEIAKIMAEQFQLTGRTGKQCRERYHNHLDNRIKHGPWSKQEEEALIALQNNMGNHWAEISRVLSGRSENCVKNKFYSILRRGVKTLNLAIKRHLKKYKELDVSSVYKIVDCCQPTYGKQSHSFASTESDTIKKQLFFYGMRDDSFAFEKEEYADIKQLIDRIRNFKKRQNGTKKPEAMTSEGNEDWKEIAYNRQEFSQTKLKKEEQGQKDCPHINNDHLYQKKQKIEEDNPLRSCFVPIEAQAQSLQSFGLEGLERDADEAEARLCLNGQIFEPILSKNMSVISNLSNIQKRSSSNENGGDFLRKESTIKSFEFPEHDIMRSSFVMMQSPHFDQLRGNFNNWSFLFQPQ